MHYQTASLEPFYLWKLKEEPPNPKTTFLLSYASRTQSSVVGGPFPRETKNQSFSLLPDVGSRHRTCGAGKPTARWCAGHDPRGSRRGAENLELTLTPNPCTTPTHTLSCGYAVQLRRATSDDVHERDQKTKVSRGNWREAVPLAGFGLRCEVHPAAVQHSRDDVECGTSQNPPWVQRSFRRGATVMKTDWPFWPT